MFLFSSRGDESFLVGDERWKRPGFCFPVRKDAPILDVQDAF